MEHERIEDRQKCIFHVFCHHRPNNQLQQHSIDIFHTTNQPGVHDFQYTHQRHDPQHERQFFFVSYRLNKYDFI